MTRPGSARASRQQGCCAAGALADSATSRLQATHGQTLQAKGPTWKSVSWHSTQPPASVSSSEITSRALQAEKVANKWHS